jgi:DNA-binding IclR family transcriptional regulator
MQEISRQTRLHMSTVFRLVETLEECKLVEKNRDTGRYRIGLKVLTWASHVCEGIDLRSAAVPVLEELNNNTRETVHLTVLDEDAAVYVHKIDSPIPLRIYSEIGRRGPLHCTGVGKVLLAAMSEQEREAWLERNPLTRHTPATILDRTKLEKELSRIKEWGYAVDREEHERHVRCVAAPVLDHAGNTLAAISITVPSVRMSSERSASLIRQVKDSAKKISMHLRNASYAAAKHPKKSPKAS